MSRKATDIAPDSARAHSVLGSALLRKGYSGQAMAHPQRAVEFEPGNVAWLPSLAASRRKLGQPEKEIVLYRQVPVMQPRNRRATEALRVPSP